MSEKLVVLLGAAFLSLVPVAIAQPVVSFTASSYDLAEFGTSVLPYATLTRTGDVNATVSYSVRVTSLLTGQLFTINRVFAKGHPTENVYVDDGGVLNDKYYNPGRNYLFTLLSVTGGSIGSPDSAEVHIIDDELPPQLVINDVFTDEGTPGKPVPRVNFTVRMTPPLPTGITIPFTVQAAYAKSGIDYVPPGSNSVHFNVGATVAEIAIDILPDREPEGDDVIELELGAPPPNSGIIVGKGTGTLIIRDDDGAVLPLAQRVVKGGKATIQIRLTDPALTTEHVVLQSPAAFLVFPSSVQIPAGASSVDVEVSAGAADGGTIFVTLPPSRGGRIYICQVSAFDPVVLSIDPLSVLVPVGGTANVTMKITPPPDTPATLSLKPTAPSVAELPPSIVVDQKGTATFPVRGVAVGFTSVSVALPESLGDVEGSTGMQFAVTVSAPTGLTITSLSQKTGKVPGGDTVKLFGFNFTGRCVVTFGGVPSPTSELPASGAVTATTPPHDAGAVDVGIRCGNSTFVSPNAFTYTAAPLSIAQLSPASGGARGGTIVVVRGANLRNGLCVARFGDVAARAIAWTGTTSMTVVSPPHAAGTVPLTLQCGSDTATFAGGFNYVDTDDAPPAIPTASPVRAAPGDRVTLFGSRFRLDDVISFETTVVPDDVVLTGSEAHVVVVPELPPGLVALSLRDVAGRTTAGPKIEITAPAAVTISQIDARLTAGAEFAVGGTGFRRALTFALGLSIVQPLSMTATRAIFRVPPGLAAGPISFTISDHGATLLSRPVDVTSGLAVTAISPPCSAREGGMTVTILGSGFGNGAMVRFGTTYAAEVAFQNGFTLTARVPPAFNSIDPAITVTNPDGTVATLTNAFAYKGAAEGGCTPRRRAARR